MEIDEKTLYALIGERIRVRRNELDITQDKLAALVNVSRTSITNIESGSQKLPLHLLYRLCIALDVEIATFLPTRSDIAIDGEDETIEIDGKTKTVHPKTASFVRSALENLEENDHAKN